MRDLLAAMMLLLSPHLLAQQADPGTIRGSVIDESTNRPVEFVNVVIHQKSDSAIVTGKITDKAGKFDFPDVHDGEYFISFGLIGYKAKGTALFLIDAQHKHLNLGVVSLVATTVELDELLVTGEKSIFNNSIDRKVYNVDQDLMSKSGSVSDLLQNVPSVQVDIDGTVTLRGSSNVLFMMNGKSSPLLKKNSAEVLQQLPASSIEKIEVITNPSAKYNPEGTAGIINIVLKKNTMLGVNGNLTANGGNQNRLNGNARLNYNPGSLNITGSYSIRKDSRNRINTDTRAQVEAASALTYYNENLNSLASPLSHTASLGADYRVDQGNSIGLAGNYFYNGFTRIDNSNKVLQSSARATINEYNRNRHDDEYEKEYGLTTYYEHQFPGEDHKLRLEFSASKSPEQEDNHYSNIYLLPVSPTSYDNTLIKNSNSKSQLSVDYSKPLGKISSFEAGYAGELNNNDFDFYGEYFDTGAQQFVRDATKTNRFQYDESIHALYATYKNSFGDFGLLGGIRTEQAFTKSTQVTNGVTGTTSYFSLYPSLHLSYKLNETAELQLSYSKRTHRPEADDLNPFPEYRDPRNVSAGNPNLLPEYIHSLEFGCQFQNEAFSILPAFYYRYTVNRFTTVTQVLNDTTLLTTRQNLSSDQAGGVELIVSGNFGDLITAHANANGFYNQIDASNLGYGGTRSITSWSGSLTFNLNLAKATRLQVNSNYNSARLTAQGESSPSYVVNTGFRQEMYDGKLSLILTVADIFRTLKRQTELNTPVLNQTLVNTRDSRIIYFGVTWHFGAPPKKSKDDQLRYDNNF